MKLILIMDRFTTKSISQMNLTRKCEISLWNLPDPDIITGQYNHTWTPVTVQFTYTSVLFYQCKLYIYFPY